MSEWGSYGSTNKGYAEAFTIFSEYDTKAYSLYAEHDEIFAGPSPEIMSAEDRERLKELGWRECPENECWAKFV